MLSKGFAKADEAVWLACLVFLGPAVLAENTEDASASQLTIEGDSAVFLQERNTIEYVGNVVAFMDGMRIVGDSVLVEMNADRIERITTNGALRPSGSNETRLSGTLPLLQILLCICQTLVCWSFPAALR